LYPPQNPDKPETKTSLAKAQSSQKKIMKRYLHETQCLCRSKKLNSHSFFGNQLYHRISGHCRKFLVLFTQNLTVNHDRLRIDYGVYNPALIGRYMDSHGTNDKIIRTMASMITNGIACFATESMFPLIKLAAVNRFTPTGGVA